MFKRPAYISILVGFLSIYCAIMLMVCLRVVFISGADFGAATPVASAVAPPAMDATDATATATEEEGPIPKKAMPLITLVYAIISFVCTVNMLDGANWARWLYTVAYLLILICDIMVFSEHFLPYVPALFIRGLVIPFLFLPGANDFFKQPN